MTLGLLPQLTSRSLRTGLSLHVWFYLRLSDAFSVVFSNGAILI